MPSWPVMVLLWVLALEGLILILAPKFVRVILDEATPSMLRIVGLIELAVVVLILLHATM